MSQGNQTCKQKTPSVLGDKTMTTITNTFRKFHSDEEGLEALQVVMIIAIAAVILVAAGTVGQSVVDFTKEKLDALKSKEVNG
jgi:Flp pilus assembly pilin Flp